MSLLSHNKYLPVPYIQIDMEGNILDYSEQASVTFNMEVQSILSLVDPESVSKLANQIKNSNDIQNLELNLATKQSAIALFDIHLSWEDSGTGHLILIAKDHSHSLVAEKLSGLQKRLAETNFELFEKKELLEQTFERLNKLSGPFIPVTHQIALVPLFGDINEGKMEAIKEGVIHQVHEGDYDVILFDFSAVSKFEPCGIKTLHDLFQVLLYISGATLKIVGIKPHHSKALHNFNPTWPVQFESSLKTALVDFIKK